MKIYTKTGDGGETGLIGGLRVKKHVPRLEACGTVDELNALLGLIRTEGLPPELDRHVEQFQNDLFRVGAELAAAAPAKPPVNLLEEAQVQGLEAAIDRLDAQMPTVSGWILPGGTRAAALLHVARTVCRRAERMLVALAEAEPRSVSAPLLAYINRLSDLLFVLARSANHRAGVSDTPWRKG